MKNKIKCNVHATHAKQKKKYEIFRNLTPNFPKSLTNYIFPKKKRELVACDCLFYTYRTQIIPDSLSELKIPQNLTIHHTTNPTYVGFSRSDQPHAHCMRCTYTILLFSHIGTSLSQPQHSENTRCTPFSIVSVVAKV